MEAITRLRQTTIVVAYKSQFEVLSNRLSSLSKSYKLTSFLSRLKDEIRLRVRMLHPNSLNSTFGLAKIQEEYVTSLHSTSIAGGSHVPFVPLSVGGSNPSANVNKKDVQGYRDNNFESSLPIQRVSHIEMNDKRVKSGNLIIIVKKLEYISWRG